jgi:hypothetical protein
MMTPLDPDRRIGLIRDGEFGNPSVIRPKDWDKVWESVLALSFE